MALHSKLNSVRGLFNKRERELSQLASLPRYTPGSFAWGKAHLQFPDARSFVFMYKELFRENIYKFNASSQAPFIIDCGANIGMSVIYFKELFPQARIIAFEPERGIFGFLEKNVRALALKDVELVNKAVWKEDGIIQFSNEGADASRISTLPGEDEFKSYYDVQAVKLSDYIDRQVDFLKLDIEGAEIEVMKEIEPKLGLISHLFIEYHSFEKNTQELDILLSMLTKHKFHYYVDSPNRSVRSPFVEKNTFYSFDFFLNIYATKKDIA